jgi:hypothetical protein
MKTASFFSHWFTIAVLGLGLALVCGCDAATTPPSRTSKDKKTGPSEQRHAEQAATQPLRLEVHGDKRRVLLEAQVPNHGDRTGYLEFFLSSTRRRDQGYESVLVTRVEAHELNEMLLAAGAVPGTPFDPELDRLPRGQILKISLRYEKDGKEITDQAQTWLQKREGGGALNIEWVFSGSGFFDPEPGANRPPIFLADESSSLISSGNSPTTLIDVNVASSNHADSSDFYYSNRIPPPGTKVTVIFEPVGVYKKNSQ